MTSEKPRQFFHRVESLRGLGALVIAGYHFTNMSLHGGLLLPNAAWEGVSPVQNALRFLALALMPGHATLMMFFVISGFVLRISLGNGPQTMGKAGSRFVISRLFRVYPIVFFAVTIGYVFALDPPPRDGIVAPTGVWNYVGRMFLIDVRAKHELWALQVEMLMVPLMVVLYFLEIRRGPAAVLGIAIATTALSFDPHWTFNRALSGHLFAVVLGMTVPIYGRRFAENASTRTARLSIIVSLAVMQISNRYFENNSHLADVLYCYAASSLISLIAYRRDLAIFKPLDAKLLRMIGQSSGSLYVLHMTTVTTAIAIGESLVPSQWCATAPALVALIMTAGWFAALIPLSICTYYLIELPGIALGRRVISRLKLNAKPRVKLTEPEEISTPLRMAA